MMNAENRDTRQNAIAANYAAAAEHMRQAADDFDAAAEAARTGDTKTALATANRTINNIDKAALLHNTAVNI